MYQKVILINNMLKQMLRHVLHLNYCMHTPEYPNLMDISTTIKGTM